MFPLTGPLFQTLFDSENNSGNPDLICKFTAFVSKTHKICTPVHMGIMDNYDNIQDAHLIIPE